MASELSAARSSSNSSAGSSIKGVKVRGEWLKMYKTLHTWVGISSGLLLFIGFFAGALTMFEEQIDQWAAPQPLAAESMAELSEAQLAGLVDTVLQQYPAARNDLTVDLSGQPTAPVSWHAGGHSHEIDLHASEHQASLGETGELLVRQQVPGQLAELIDQLHRSAGIAGEIGHDILGVYLMGVAAFLYSLALVSGLVLVLPTIVRDFLVLRPEKSKKRFWLDAHNLIGITSLPFHIVIAFTVVVFAFHDVFYDSLAEAVYGDKPMFGPRGAAPAVSYEIEQLPPFDELLQTIRKEVPGFGIKSVELSKLESPRPMARVAIENPDFVSRGAREGYLILNPYTGEVTNRNVVPGQEDLWSGIVASFFGIHFGSFGGMPMKWLYFALGISGAFVFYSGNLLWVESRRKKLQRASPSRQRFHSVTVMRALTNGVCLGTLAGVVVAMLVARLGAQFFATDMGVVNQWVLNSYYLTFFGWLLWAWCRRMQSQRGATELLLATGLLALLLPLSGAMLAGMQLASYNLVTLSVEITALVAGVLLIIWAAVLHRRSSAGLIADKPAVV